MVTVRALRKGSSSSAVMRSLIRQIRLICVSYDIQFCAAHIAGVDNIMADSFSRGLLASRCASWSFNRYIMQRWMSFSGGFDIDAFSDPSGRSSQGVRHCHVAKDPSLPIFKDAQSGHSPLWISWPNLCKKLQTGDAVYCWRLCQWRRPSCRTFGGVSFIAILLTTACLCGLVARALCCALPWALTWESLPCNEA